MELDNILKAKKMTKAAFAEKLGIAPQNVNVLFKNPTEQRIKDAAAALGVSVSQLLGESAPHEGEATNDFCAFIRYNGIHYTADTIDEFNKITEELKTITK